MTVIRLPTPPSTAGAEPKKNGQDAGDITKPNAVKAEETKALHLISAVQGTSVEDSEQFAEGMSTEKTKESCPVDSIEVKSGSPRLSNNNSCHVSEGTQMPDLSQCHTEDTTDNSQAFAEWKGSSRPSCPKWGPPPYLRGHASGSSGPEVQNEPSDATASTERSCGQHPSVPPFN